MGLCAGIIFNLEASATSLIVEGGKLTGATGIQLGSSFYDVEFLDGSCENLFNGCNSLNDFLFNETMAIASAEALRDEVFIGLYDTNPELTRGVTDSARGNIITPYGFHVDPWTGYIKAQGVTNISADGIDSVYLGAVAPGWDTGGAANYTYARWTQADPIIDLEDAIIGLQVITGNETSVLYESWMDVNDDGKIGLEETIYALQVVADLKPDNDGDGYTENQGDCNDVDASINPGADEICGDGIDQDCAGGDAQCGGVGNCEVVTSGPSTLTIINDRNVGVSTDFQGAAFGSNIRPFKCEIYGYSGITRVDFIQCNFIGDTCYENTFGQTVTVNISDGMTIRTSNLF